MKNVVLIFVFSLLSSLIFSQQKGIPQLTSEFDKLLSEQFKSNETGASVLVTRKGQIIYQKAFGKANLELNVPMQVDNVFGIGSITKQFTAIAILQLMEQGKLKLTDEITRFIPDYPAQGHKITIEHLLTHTSGIQDYSSLQDTTGRGRIDFTPREMVDYFKNRPMRFDPGTKYEYSNSGYFLLGYIIEIISGRTYAKYLEDNFFKPIDMTHSLYSSDRRIVKNRVKDYTKGENGFENADYASVTQPYAAGSILSTTGDLFKWHQAVLSHKLVTKQTLDRAFTGYKLAGGQQIAYGYGWRTGAVYESPSIWHGGLINGFMSMVIYLPKEDVFVAVFSNCVCNSPEIITARLAALTVGKPLEYKEVPLVKSKQPEYTGVYENQKGQVRIISVVGDKLNSQVGRAPGFNLRAYQKDRFFIEQGLTTVAFLRNDRGEIEKLVVETLRGNEVWNKTNKPIPSNEGIAVDEKLLETYTGEYQVTPEFTFAITREQGRLFLQGAGQERLELFAETESKFFLKVNDTQVEFVKDGSGNVIKAIIKQGNRQADAKKVK
ncbi:MAG: serine hydrolase [Chitinophagaceae bacterium]|nr:serine hydrolase [Chitinophagaceae bacterium]